MFCRDCQYKKEGCNEDEDFCTKFKIGLAEIHYVFNIVNECEYK